MISEKFKKSFSFVRSLRGVEILIFSILLIFVVHVLYIVLTGHGNRIVFSMSGMLVRYNNALTSIIVLLSVGVVAYLIGQSKHDEERDFIKKYKHRMKDDDEDQEK